MGLNEPVLMVPSNIFSGQFLTDLWGRVPNSLYFSALGGDRGLLVSAHRYCTVNSSLASFPRRCSSTRVCRAPSRPRSSTAHTVKLTDYVKSATFKSYVHQKLTEKLVSRDSI